MPGITFRRCVGLDTVQEPNAREMLLAVKLTSERHLTGATKLSMPAQTQQIPLFYSIQAYDTTLSICQADMYATAAVLFNLVYV